MRENIWELLFYLVVGRDTYKVQFVEDLVNDWNTQLKLLSTMEETQTQVAYLEFVSKISYQLVSLEETLCNRIIPAITGGHICNNTERKLLSFPTRFGGLTTPFFMNKPQ